MKRQSKRTILAAMILTLAVGGVFSGCGRGNGSESIDGANQGDQAASVEINISAAASLTDALTEIQTEYQKQADVVLVFNFAASGALQKQIREGAPCDLFLSASEEHMDGLEAEGLIVSESRADLLGNALTLIASSEQSENIKNYNDLTKTELSGISIGTPESVPAGKYAKQALQNLGIWDKLEDRIIYAKDVRQVLEYVDTGNADCGLVYKSDTLAMKTGTVVMDLPESSHAPIVYPIALIKDSTQQEAAAAFYKFLQTDYAAGVFEKYGFTVL